MFKKLTPIWELEIFRNRISMREPDTGRSGERHATYPFSSASELIAEPECLEQEVRLLSEELFGRAGFLGRYPEMRVVRLQNTISDEGRRLLRKALADAGASKVTLPED